MQVSHDVDTIFLWSRSNSDLKAQSDFRLKSQRTWVWISAEVFCSRYVYTLRLIKLIYSLTYRSRQWGLVSLPRLRKKSMFQQKIDLCLQYLLRDMHCWRIWFFRLLNKKNYSGYRSTTFCNLRKWLFILSSVQESWCPSRPQLHLKVDVSSYLLF